MANYATLKTAIESTIRTNGQEEITGQILQNAIIALIESLGAEFQFAGVASTNTNPGTPDYKVMYIAGAGTYPNFGGTVVEKGHIGVFAYNGSWNNVVVETGAYFEFQEYPSGDAIEFTFYDSDNTDGKTIKINKTVSGISNAPDEAISQWWAAQIQRKIQDVQGFTDNFTSLSTTEQSLGLFGIIKTGKVIDSITGVNKLIFIDDESNEYTVNTTDLPYVAPADFVSVKLQSGTASNVSINVRGDNDVLISHININEIANHPSAYTSAALALNDVPTLYRRKGMKVVYYDDTLSLWVEMLNVDDAGANWWTDVTNNWVIEGPIETELPTNTGGQQLRVGGTKRGNLDDVLNVNVWNNQATEYSSKDNARAAVPSNKRKLGAIITYLVSTGSDTSDWMIDEFIGSSISDWTEADNWKTIGPVSVSQNTETGHTDINVGGVITPVLSVEEKGQNILFNGDVDYSAQGYNRFLVNMVELPMPSKDVILETINTTDCKLAVELYYTDETKITILKGGNVLMAFNEAKNIYKVRAFFQTADQPDGYVKINVFTQPSIYWDIVNNFIIEQKDKSNTNNDLQWKADIDVGVNLVNPVFVESGKYFRTNGEIATTTIQNYKISGYIPVNGQNIICNGDNASSTSTFVVYDKDYNQLRTQVNSGKQYNYQDGDCYVRITFATSGTCYANYGTTLSQVTFTKYAHYDSLQNELDTKFASVPIENIINGIKTVCVNANEMNAGNPVYYEAIDFDSFIYKSLATTANCWVASKLFQPNLSLPVKIKAKAKLLQGTERKINLWVSPTLTYDSQRTTSYHSFTFPEGVNEMDIEFSFDPQYFVVYKNYTTDFSIWLQSKGDGTTATHIQYDDFAIFQKIGEQTFNNFSGEDLLELLHSLDENFPTDVEVAEDENIKVAPNGKKFVLQVANNGDLITIPVIPTKTHFFGNSLLSGNAFGMAASDQYHDYYYLINNFISSQITGYSSGKSSCSTFEQASTIEAARTQIQSLVANLTGEEELVFVQIGDNVSQANLSVFATSFKEFILSIRNVCQTARVIIFGCWYSIPERIEILSRVARETGCLFINITDLKTIANQSFIGAIQQRTYSASFTLENVTNVVDNGEVHTGYAHNITVTFTVSDATYTATVDCTTYSLDGTTLKYTSDYYIIPNNGIASHPGDAGFKAITNRVLYKSGMVDTENYFN